MALLHPLTLSRLLRLLLLELLLLLLALRLLLLPLVDALADVLRELLEALVAHRLAVDRGDLRLERELCAAAVALEARLVVVIVREVDGVVRDDLLADAAQLAEELVVVEEAVRLAVVLKVRALGEEVAAHRAAEALGVVDVVQGGDRAPDDGLAALGADGPRDLAEARRAEVLALVLLEVAAHELRVADLAAEVLDVHLLPVDDEVLAEDRLLALRAQLAAEPLAARAHLLALGAVRQPLVLAVRLAAQLRAAARAHEVVGVPHLLAQLDARVDDRALARLAPRRVALVEVALAVDLAVLVLPEPRRLVDLAPAHAAAEALGVVLLPAGGEELADDLVPARGARGTAERQPRAVGTDARGLDRGAAARARTGAHPGRDGSSRGVDAARHVGHGDAELRDQVVHLRHGGVGGRGGGRGGFRLPRSGRDETGSRARDSVSGSRARHATGTGRGGERRLVRLRCRVHRARRCRGRRGDGDACGVCRDGVVHALAGGWRRESMLRRWLSRGCCRCRRL